MPDELTFESWTNGDDFVNDIFNTDDTKFPQMFFNNSVVA